MSFWCSPPWETRRTDILCSGTEPVIRRLSWKENITGCLRGCFLHFGIYHIAYNMLCLLLMGNYLEEIVGSVRYAVIYLGAGLAGNLLSMGLELRSGSFAVSAGASGAIFGVMGALFYVVLRGRGQVGSGTQAGWG